MNDLTELEQIIKASKESKELQGAKHKELLNKLTDVVEVVINKGEDLEANVKRLSDIVDSLPEKVKQETIAITNFPSDVQVNNLKDIKIPSNVEVKRPEWIKELKNDDTQKILNAVKDLKQGNLSVNISNKDARDYIPVRLSNGRDFYTAIMNAVSQGVVPFVTSAGNRKSALVDTDGKLQTDTVIDETPPTDSSKNNGSTALSYDANGDLQYVDETIDGTTYRTTLSYTSRVLSGVSEAVEL